MSDGPRTQPVPAGPEHLAEGRYQLHRRLGSGGMSIVLQATDTRLQREVAVKLLADNLAEDATARERFLREARMAAGLSDPHIVQIHDVAEEEGRPYLVMELVEGPSLAEVLAREGPLAPQEVVDVAADALTGLSQAHERGLLHRDIKPGNLLRTPTGVVKVADFGVARAGDDPELTRGGTVVGTAPYLAPERRKGAAASVATDLYALGTTLHELLAGRTPDPDGAAVPDVALPGTLAHLLERLLADDPTRRPASARSALALLAGEVDTGGPMPVEEPPSPPLAATTSERTEVTAPSDRTAGVSGPGAGAADAEPEEADATDPGAGEAGAQPAPGGPVVSWGVVVAVAVALLLLAVGFQAMRGPDETQAPPRVERGDEDVDTARNLAEWLRERAGE